jgi:hypothetical protein
MSHARRTEKLAIAVAAMPRALCAAMLAAVRRERIIAGAYADGDGMCPLLGAHRYGMRESGGGAFPEAWDRFCRIRRGKGRDATDAERAVLVALLEQRLFPDAPTPAHGAPAPVREAPLEVRV